MPFQIWNIQNYQGNESVSNTKFTKTLILVQLKYDSFLKS